MASMDYCKFENTRDDLLRCREDFDENGYEPGEKSTFERIARYRLLCIVKEWAEEIDEDDLEAEAETLTAKGLLT